MRNTVQIGDRVSALIYPNRFVIGVIVEVSLDRYRGSLQTDNGEILTVLAPLTTAVE